MRRLSPGRILAAMRARLAAAGARARGAGRALGSFGGGVRGRLGDARYLVEDVLYVCGRFLRRSPRAIARGAGAFWGGLERRTRMRLAAAVGAVVGLLAFFALAGPQLPCGIPGGAPCPPPDNARELVPAGALAYLHVDLDTEREQVAEAEEVIARLPAISEQVLGDSLELAPGEPLTMPDLVRDVGPWVGDEAALALVAVGAQRAEPVWLLAVDDAAGADAFASDVIGRRAETDEHRGVEIVLDAGGRVATARLEGFLAIGPTRALREVINVAHGADGADSIDDEPIAADARDELPPERVVEAYFSPEGAVLAAEADGALGLLAPLVAPEWTRGAAVALSAEDGELELTVRSALDADRPEAEPGFLAALASFEPELPEELAEDSLAYVGLGRPEETVRELLALATADAPGIASGFEGLANTLRRDGEVDIERQLLPALGDEAAFAIEPRDGAAAAAEPAPFLEFLARDVDGERAQEALARLQGPVVAAIEPTVELQAPVFSEFEIDGVETRALRISPTIELTYAIVDELAVIATDRRGVARVVAGDGGLDEAELYGRATAEFPDELSLLAFLDLSGLVAIGEQLGLAADPAYAFFAAEIRALHGLGLAIRLDEEMLATDLRLIIGEPAEPEVPLPPPAPPPEEAPEAPLEPEAPFDPDVPPGPQGPPGPGLPPELQIPGLEPPPQP